MAHRGVLRPTDSVQQLAEFQTRDRIQRFISDNYARSTTADQATEIASYFIQADEYYSNAQRADFSVRPVLQYYAMLSFSRGLILLLEPRRRQASLKSAHGLNCGNWASPIKESRLQDLAVNVCQGTFCELLAATHNRSYYRSNSSAANWTVEYPIPQTEISVAMRCVVATLPDLKSEYEAWCGEPLVTAKVEAVTPYDQGYGVSLATLVDSDQIDAIIPAEFRPSVKDEPVAGHSVLHCPDGCYPNFAQLWHGAFEIGDMYVSPAYPGDVHLNSLGGLFIVSFILGSLCRYYPSVWVRLRRIEKGDRFYTVALRLMDLLDDVFPRLVLDFLEAPFGLPP